MCSIGPNRCFFLLLFSQFVHKCIGIQKRTCTYSDGCQTIPILSEHDSLIVSLEGGTELLIHFDKGEFTQDFVASDEALLRRTLRAYYALQP